MSNRQTNLLSRRVCCRKVKFLYFVLTYGVFAAYYSLSCREDEKTIRMCSVPVIFCEDEWVTSLTLDGTPDSSPWRLHEPGEGRGSLEKSLQFDKWGNNCDRTQLSLSKLKDIVYCQTESGLWLWDSEVMMNVVLTYFHRPSSHFI